MIVFSLFRNGKETVNPKWFRARVTYECQQDYTYAIEFEIWMRFIERHKRYGGAITTTDFNFIQEAKSMGFSVQPVEY